MLWQFRGAHYSSASTAHWAYNAEELELLDIAEKVATPLVPAYGTKVVKHPTLSTEWTPVVGTSIGGETFLTHKGVYDVWVRVYSIFGRQVWLRLLYDLGDMISPSENVQQQIPGGEAWYLVNLGQINLGALPFGAQRWEGVIAARGENGGQNVYIDRVWFLCGDEGSGVLRASTESSALPSIKASDSLKGEGTLGGSTATRGGKWEELGAGGAFTRTAESTQRETTLDKEEGHTALLSESTIGACTVKVQGEAPFREGVKQGVYLRYFDSSHWIRAAIFDEGKSYFLILYEYQNGGSVISGPLARTSHTLSVNLEASISADGIVSAFSNLGESFPTEVPSTFKVGEAHAEGKVGIFDRNTSATAWHRMYRYFVASPLPPGDAVTYANRNARLSTNGMYRQSEDGKGYGPVSYPGSDLPRLPVSGPGEDPVEIALKPTRGDTLTLADAGKDAFTAQLTYRPCWSEVPSE